MLSPFGIDHGEVFSKGPITGAMAVKTSKLKPLVGRGLPGKHAKPMAAQTAGTSTVGRRRLGGGTHTSGLFAR